jgi:hypothetical protein
LTNAVERRLSPSARSAANASGESRRGCGCHEPASTEVIALAICASANRNGGAEGPTRSYGAGTSVFEGGIQQEVRPRAGTGISEPRVWAAGRERDRRELRGQEKATRSEGSETQCPTSTQCRRRILGQVGALVGLIEDHGPKLLAGVRPDGSGSPRAEVAVRCRRP